MAWVPSILFASAVALTACLGSGERSRSRVPSSIHVPNLERARISPSGSFVLTTSWPKYPAKRKKTTLIAWSMRDGSARFVNAGFIEGIDSIQISPDDRYLALTSLVDPQYDYAMGAGPQLMARGVSIRDAKTGRGIESKSYIGTDPSCYARFIDSHTYVLAVHNEVHTLDVRNSAVTETSLVKLPGTGARVLDISRDGKRLLACCNRGPFDFYPKRAKQPNSAIVLIDATTGKVIHRIGAEYFGSAGFSRKGDWFYMTESRGREWPISFSPLYAYAFETESGKKLWEKRVRVAYTIRAEPSRDGKSLHVTTTTDNESGVAGPVVHSVFDSQTGEPLPAVSPYQGTIESGFAYSEQPNPTISDNGSVMIATSGDEITIWTRDDDQCKWDSC